MDHSKSVTEMKLLVQRQLVLLESMSAEEPKKKGLKVKEIVSGRNKGLEFTGETKVTENTTLGLTDKEKLEEDIAKFILPKPKEECWELSNGDSDLHWSSGTMWAEVNYWRDVTDFNSGIILPIVATQKEREHRRHLLIRAAK